MLFVVIATGQSLTSQQVDRVRQYHERKECGAIAVSNAYQLTPWADALVSHDKNWWENHRDAEKFAGRKFAGSQIHGIERLDTTACFPSGCNSGLQAMRVAHEKFGATHIVLLGVDMRGTHYFGPHPHPLRNTTDKRFQAHIAQFSKWRGCPVTNCSPGSALTQFPMKDLDEVLRP